MKQQQRLDTLLKYLNVRAVTENRFLGKSPAKPERIFGGQVLAQALNAAAKTVAEDRLAHSLHAYFLRPGDPTIDIIYEVEVTRDGRSFSTRRVVAWQDKTAIFEASMSFQVKENGLSHQMPRPKADNPENLEEDQAYRQRLLADADDSNNPLYQSPIKRYTEKPRDPKHPEIDDPVQNVWFNIPQTLPDTPRIHQVLLAYLSDFTLLGAALRPHPYTIYGSDIKQFASIDHCLWFHRPARVDQFLLYAQDSPNAESARGFSRGSFYTQDGLLIASSAQESLLRI